MRKGGDEHKARILAAMLGELSTLRDRVRALLGEIPDEGLQWVVGMIRNRETETETGGAFRLADTQVDRVLAEALAEEIQRRAAH